MELFRKRFIMLSFLVVTGLTFLNMSFFLAEISAMKTSYDKTALENIARMFTASLSEEETETSASEGGAMITQIDFLEDNLYHLRFEDNGISKILKTRGYHSFPHPGFSQIESPPPDRSFIG
jgi:hypothetical protein